MVDTVLDRRERAKPTTIVGKDQLREADVSLKSNGKNGLEVVSILEGPGGSGGGPICPPETYRVVEDSTGYPINNSTYTTIRAGTPHTVESFFLNATTNDYMVKFTIDNNVIFEISTSSLQNLIDNNSQFIPMRLPVAWNSIKKSFYFSPICGLVSSVDYKIEVKSVGPQENQSVTHLYVTEH